MSDLTEHPQVREAFRRFTVGGSYNGMSLGDSVLRAKNELVSAIVSAYRSSLAGETEQETLEKARRYAVNQLAVGLFESETWVKDWSNPEPQTDRHRDARRLVGRFIDWLFEYVRAPLLVQLQDKEARIKALEAALEAHAGCLATDRCPACSAIPEAP